MLELTRLSGQRFALNPDLIERAEATPDTVVTLVNGSKYVVLESLAELIDLVRVYRADVVTSARSGSLSATTANRLRLHTRDQQHGQHPQADDATVVVLRSEQGVTVQTEQGEL